MNTVVVIGNGESRSIINFQELRGKIPLIGCNAIHREFYVDRLICCDQRMAHEVLGRKKSRKIQFIYTRDRYYQYLKNKTDRIFLLPELPHSGPLKQDLPDHWGSGPYAVLLAASLNYEIVCLLGFDLYGQDNLINNIYKGTQNYLPANARAVDPSYWIYQIKKVFQYYPNTKFKIYNTESWQCPVEWRLPNVEILNIRNFTID